MARGWKCPRCSTQNGEGVMNCAKCGLIQGGVFVPSTYVPPEVAAAAATGSTESREVPETPAAPDAAPAAAPAPAGEPATATPSGPGFAALTPTSPPATTPSPGWVPPYPIAAPASRPLWRRVPLGLVIFLVLVVGGGVAGFITNASRSTTGDITKGGDMSSNDLRVGDCWDMKDPTAETVENVTAKPCGEAHEYEVFFIGAMADGTYPTDDRFSAYVNDNCLPAFETFVGHAYDDSSLDVTWLNPLSKGWAIGDRTVECSVYDPNNNKLTASMQGAGR